MERFRNIPGGMLIAFVIGVIDSLIVWAIASLLDVTILVPEGQDTEVLTELTLPPILFIVGASSILAGILLWILQRFVPDRAVQIFQVIAVIVLAVSLISPFMLDQPTEGRLALLAMHLLVGSAIIAVFTWVGTRPRRLRPQSAVEN